MTRRENRRTRRAPVREERTQVLVVCGGVATEPAYFRGLKKERRNAAMKVVVEAKCDEVWCVTDVDEFDVPAAITAAKSDLCFTDFAPGVDDAIERARCRCDAGTEHTGNPSTGVWALVLKVV